jgi:DNA-binding response OmpR family regulator
LQAGSVDVLILDIGHMPGAAFDLLAKFPQLKHAIPVIVVSGESIKNGSYGDAFVLDGIVNPLDGPTFIQTIIDSIATCQAKSPQILIVEDDPAMRSVIKLQITELGIRCLEAHDGQHALELVRSQTPDLIVLDVGLPKLDGFALIAALKQEAKNVPVIVYTARDLSREDKEALSLGLTRYLTKSQNSVQDLLSAVRELLSGMLAGKK